jgi:mono/diheme cytochrome c family protein
MNTQLRVHWLLALVACGFCLAAALSSAAVQVPPAADKPSQPKSGAATSTAGEKIFMANCARCHTPPMTLRPSATGAVVMHMRVRARLSRKDEKLLLQYLAP